MKLDKEKIRQMRDDGFSYGAIAKILGASENGIRRICVKIGCAGVRCIDNPFSKPYSEEHVSEVAKMAGLEYVSGYKNASSNIMVKCRKCGNVFTTHWSTLNSFVHHTLKCGYIGCRKCWKAEKPQEPTELQKKIVALANQGKNRKEIIRELNCANSTMEKVLKRYNICLPRSPHVTHVSKGRQMPDRRKYDYEEIRKLREDGKGYNEIADRIGATKCVISEICRKMGLGGTRGRKQGNSINKVEEVVSKAGFDYMSGYETSKSKITVRCMDCGRTFDVMYHTLQEFVDGTYNARTVSCKLCRSERIIQNREEKRSAEEESRAKAKVERDKLKEERDKLKEEKRFAYMEYRNQKRVCQCCKKEYTIQDTGYRSEMYCSKKCSNSACNRKRLDRRVKRIKERVKDRDITLEMVFAMDMGMCYLCGKPCDWNDIKECKGTMIAGNQYPSIDHVKPLSRGGEHSWGNVRLAHRICNVHKNDQINFALYTPHSSLARS